MISSHVVVGCSLDVVCIDGTVVVSLDDVVAGSQDTAPCVAVVKGDTVVRAGTSGCVTGGVKVELSVVVGGDVLSVVDFAVGCMMTSGKMEVVVLSDRVEEAVVCCGGCRL